MRRALLDRKSRSSCGLPSRPLPASSMKSAMSIHRPRLTSQIKPRLRQSLLEPKPLTDQRPRPRLLVERLFPRELRSATVLKRRTRMGWDARKHSQPVGVETETSIDDEEV